MRIKKFNVIIGILLISIMTLTACGVETSVTSEQERKWEETVSQIETQKEILAEKVNVVKEYYNSLDADVKAKIPMPGFDVPNDINMPQKAKDFEESYESLQNNLEKIKDTITAVPSKESFEEQVKEIMPTVVEEREEKVRADAEKKAKEETERKLAAKRILNGGTGGVNITLSNDLPETFATLNYRDVVEQKYEITNVSAEKDDYGRIYIYVDGTKTFDIDGDNQKFILPIRLEIVCRRWKNSSRFRNHLFFRSCNWRKICQSRGSFIFCCTGKLYTYTFEFQPLMI